MSHFLRAKSTTINKTIDTDFIATRVHVKSHVTDDDKIISR